MIELQQNLQSFNTFGISVVAKRFSSFKDLEELQDLIQKREPNEPLLILGGGSNILFTHDFEGLVLKNEIKGREIIQQDPDYVLIKAGAGEVWHDFVLFCLDHNFGGLENLSLIPGNVGASPMQNIGAYGVEIKDVFHSLEAFHIASGEVHTFHKDNCQFGYRESVFKNKFKGEYVILNVTYKLTTKKHNIHSSYGAIQSELTKLGIYNPTIRDISSAVIAIRSSKLPDPKVIGNAGSFFKNPVVESSTYEKILIHHPDAPSYPAKNGHVKLAAGWLIEKAGWKGKQIDNYGVHKLQALVLVNYGGSKGEDIYQLSDTIISDIERKFGVTLEREVNIL